MKYKDIIELIEIKDNYKDLGLKIGDIGVIVSQKKDNKFLVSFLDIEKKSVICIIYIEEKDMKIWEKQNTNKKSFDGIPIKPYNNVMLMTDRKQYALAGVKKGDVGIIVNDFDPTFDCWLVDFTDIGDEICLEIKSKDLRIIE